jgi:hypothetical protein
MVTDAAFERQGDCFFELLPHSPPTIGNWLDWESLAGEQGLKRLRAVGDGLETGIEQPPWGHRRAEAPS